MRCPQAALLPPAVAVVAITSLASSVHLARTLGHLPPGVATPPLSIAGIRAPEYYVFAAGLASTAFALLYIEALYTRALTPSLRAAAAEGGADGGAAVAALSGVRSWARAGFAGLALVGLLPLEGWGGLASAAHSLGALVFFIGSLQHGFGTLSALSSPALSAPCPISRARAPILWTAKGVALGSALLAFGPAQWLHPGDSGANSEVHALNVGGFTQWWLVGSLLCYFALFSADFYVLAKETGADVKKAPIKAA